MIKVLKQMVDVLEYWDVYGGLHQPTEEAIEAGKQAIAELESQEPVAWMDADGNVSDNNDHKCFPIPLYTHPLQRTAQEWFSEVIGNALFDFQEATGCDTAEEFKAQRTWVGLTDEQMLECNMDGDLMIDRETAKRNVEAKLKELNT